MYIFTISASRSKLSILVTLFTFRILQLCLHRCHIHRRHISYAITRPLKKTDR